MECANFCFKCTKSFFGWLCPGPLEAYSTPPDPLPGAGEGVEKNGKEGEREKGKGKEGKRRGTGEKRFPPNANRKWRPCVGVIAKTSLADHSRPLAAGRSRLQIIHCFMHSRSLHPKQNVDPFSRFCRAH